MKKFIFFSLLCTAVLPLHAMRVTQKVVVNSQKKTFLNLYRPITNQPSFHAPSSRFFSQQNKQTEVQEKIERLKKHFPDKVLTRFMRDFNVPITNKNQLEKLKEEWIRYALMTKESRQELDMYGKEVDKLWHTFLLFNKDYEHFCKQLGQVVYHIPVDPETTQQGCPTLCQWTKKAQFIKLYRELYKTEPDTSIWSGLQPCKNSCKEKTQTLSDSKSDPSYQWHSSCGSSNNNKVFHHETPNNKRNLENDSLGACGGSFIHMPNNHTIENDTTSNTDTGNSCNSSSCSSSSCGGGSD